jgi:hypothetical protein
LRDACLGEARDDLQDVADTLRGSGGIPKSIVIPKCNVSGSGSESTPDPLCKCGVPMKYSNDSHSDSVNNSQKREKPSATDCIVSSATALG